MNEAEKRIREALAAGPTPGPWHHDSDPVKNDPLHRVRFRVTAKGRTITETYYSSAQPGAPFTSGETDNRFIAACNPVNVAALLADRDEREARLTRERDEHARWRAELADKLHATESLVSELRAERDALAKDAGRYQFLRAHRTLELNDNGTLGIEFVCDFDHYDDLDAAIDAQIE